jgi:hypothetical protein
MVNKTCRLGGDDCICGMCDSHENEMSNEKTIDRLARKVDCTPTWSSLVGMMLLVYETTENQENDRESGGKGRDV